MTEQFSLPTLLIISDNPSIRYWLKKQLASQFSLIEATTRSKAIETALHSALHFIILDAAFKAYDFLLLASELRQTPSNLLTPILLITDKLKKSYRTTAQEAGVTDFLFQPLDADELAAKIDTIKKAGSVRHKVLGLSSRISAPKQQEPSSSFFKNKVLLHDQALQVLTDAKKRGVPVKMLVVRIDRFAEIQAKIGAPASQTILQSFGELLNKSIGKNSTITPFTNGQFIVLLPEIGLPESQKIAENLRKLVEQQRFTTKQGILHLTASFAISDVDTTEKSFNRMIDSTTKSLDQSSTFNNQVFFIDKKDS
jgi:diguanylate cyclase (GGDEF)-like protein